MKNLNIYYTPYSNGINSYTNRMVEILSRQGNVVRLNRKNLFRKFLTLNYNDVIVVNWLENNIVSRGGKISYWGFISTLFMFLFFRLFFKKFIFVKHNHYPHNCNENDIDLAIRMVCFLEKISTISVVHSMVEETENRQYIPHPLYFGGEINTVKNNNETNAYIIFGSISRYKKIENILCKLPENINLIVAGKCVDLEYLKELKDLSFGRNNIEFITDYIADEDAIKLIKKCNGMIICHNDKDMIVSGSFFYAISVGSKVYCLENSFFKWASLNLGNEYIEIFENTDSMLQKISDVGDSSICVLENNLSPFNLFNDRIIGEKWEKILK
ncbi:hypothetical protein MST16_16405 [Acinetobacter sp. YH16040_T]|uniref:hypothetical protein n=1 Tax=unclassified Acinetobacter TaxID=196816 RepID=UPI0015D40FFC|nr:MULTISPECIES: hypothetical protein [unclassified Acinetobacter]UUS57565.1 hypothetical protein MST16_16405 [Acinetobacter sp. YH16040_T]